jgi:Protein of unknown function (DUF3987)
MTAAACRQAHCHAAGHHQLDFEQYNSGPYRFRNPNKQTRNTESHMSKKKTLPTDNGNAPADTCTLTETETSSAYDQFNNAAPLAPQDDGYPGWEQPLNFFGKLAAQPFGSEHVPTSLGSYPAAYATQTGIDFGIALGGALAAAASALNDAFQIVADEPTGYWQSARLWILALAPSGSGKSPAQAHMLAPLDAIARAELALYEKRSATAKTPLRAGTETGEAERLPKPRIIVRDTTIEALSEVLRDTPRGVLIATDEIVSWLGSMDAYRGKSGSRDRGEWLRLFDGGSHTIERIQRGSINIPNWGCSILTATTSVALSKLAKQLPEDGLLQRFIAIVSSRQQDSVPVENIDSIRGEYEKLIERLYRLAPLPTSRGKIHMTLAAKSAFQAWRRENRQEQEGFESVDPGLAAHIAKHPSFALRLALLFHCAETLAGEAHPDAHPENLEVTEECMRLAFRFLKRAQNHALALYLSLKGESEVMNLARKVAKTILARNLSTFARRDLVGNGAFRGVDPRRQDEALQLLEDLCWVRPADQRNSTRPSQFDVNPGIPSKFLALAKEERLRRLRVKEAITDSVAERRDGG